MDHKTAVMVLVNAMQSDQAPEDIQKEIDALLETVSLEDRAKVLKDAKETFAKVEAGLPVDGE